MEFITDAEKVQRGYRANNLLCSDIFDETLDALRAVLLAELENLSTDNHEPVMAIMRQLRSLRHIRGRLESWVQVGRLITMQEEGSTDD